MTTVQRVHSLEVNFLTSTESHALQLLHAHVGVGVGSNFKLEAPLARTPKMASWTCMLWPYQVVLFSSAALGCLQAPGQSLS